MPAPRGRTSTASRTTSSRGSNRNRPSARGIALHPRPAGRVTEPGSVDPGRTVTLLSTALRTSLVIVIAGSHVSTAPLSELIPRAFRGERVPLARAISMVENEGPGSIAVLDASFERSGRAFRIGITGPPGAGKSTLVTRLAQEYRKRDEKVAIVAVDPTSPFTGGALLGDRVRMAELA